MATAARTSEHPPMKAEALAALPADTRAELVDGTLVMMTPAFGDHGSVAVRIARALGDWADAHDAGPVFDSSTGFILARDPDVLRSPDVAFVRRERLPRRLRAFLEVGPDVVVELLSSSDTVRATSRRLTDYFQAGTQLIWLVDPAARSVGVYAAGTANLPRWLEEGETLDGGEVLPGFGVPVARLFVDLPRDDAPEDGGETA